MEADFTTDNAATARLRRAGAGTFQRATRTLFASLRRKQSRRLLSNDARAVLSSAAATSNSRQTQKALWRLPAAASSLDQLTSGGFQPVIVDAEVSDPARVERIVLCSGKVFYDLSA